jgi:hypothetical protein
MCTECWPEYLTEGVDLENLSMVVRITDLREVGGDGVEWNYLPRDRGQLEHGNESSGFVKGCRFIEYFVDV